MLFCSIIRNGRYYCERYVQQAKALADELVPQNSIHVVIGEGDSADGTRQVLDQLLRASGLSYEIPDVTTGGGWYGSTVHPERFRNKAKADNAVFQCIRPEDDIVVFVEADLLWTSDVMVKCIDIVKSGVDVFSPMTFASTAFYDLWAFEKDSVGFGPFPPFHHALAPTGLTEIDSAGSCLVMKAEIPRAIAVPEEEEWRSFCKVVRRKGYHIYTSPELRINHPA